MRLVYMLMRRTCTANTSRCRGTTCEVQLLTLNSMPAWQKVIQHITASLNNALRSGHCTSDHGQIGAMVQRTTPVRS